jgi:uncharacterized protein (DUF1697 family)
MEELRRIFQSLELREVETFIASGNVILASNATNEEALRKKIEKRLEAELGYGVETFLRTDEELARIAQHARR